MYCSVVDPHEGLHTREVFLCTRIVLHASVSGWGAADAASTAGGEGAPDAAGAVDAISALCKT